MSTASSEQRPANVKTRPVERDSRLLKIVFTALTAALSYVVFTFLQIKIPLAGGDATSLHLGNAVVVLGALLLGGGWGGVGGAIGMTIADLMDPIYIVYAPKTFICKLGIGLITGLVAHHFGKITKTNDKAHVRKYVIGASIAGMAFNVVADPLIGYVYKLLILGKPAADITLSWNIAASGINAVVSVIVASLVYLALRPALIKAHLFMKVGK